MNDCRPLGSLVAENELVHFLKLARPGARMSVLLGKKFQTCVWRPEWSKPRRRGRSDIVRVLAKLKAGVLRSQAHQRGTCVSRDS